VNIVGVDEGVAGDFETQEGTPEGYKVTYGATTGGLEVVGDLSREEEGFAVVCVLPKYFHQGVLCSSMNFLGPFSLGQEVAKCSCSKQT